MDLFVEVFDSRISSRRWKRGHLIRCTRALFHASRAHRWLHGRMEDEDEHVRDSASLPQASAGCKRYGQLNLTRDAKGKAVKAVKGNTQKLFELDGRRHSTPRYYALEALSCMKSKSRKTLSLLSQARAIGPST